MFRLYINQRTERDVPHDVSFAPGETRLIDHKSRGWQLTAIDPDPFFMNGA